MRWLLGIMSFVFLLMAGCISDGIDTAPGARVEFSTDTLNFGTVFTDIGSPTGRLIVRNPQKKGIVLETVRLANDNGIFAINVDGVSGHVFHDVEIRGGDSIYVYVECFIPADDEVAPFKVSDRIDFTVNGNTSGVVVEATGQNAVRLNGVTVEGEMTLTDAMPYLISDTLRVAPGAVLKVGPGTQMLFHDRAAMVVEGRLEAVGEPGRMIAMRGDRLDNVLPDVGYDILAGQWGGVRIKEESYGNRMEYVDMRSTSWGVMVLEGDLEHTKLSIGNSWLHNSKTSVLGAEPCVLDVWGSCFSEAPQGVVFLEGGRHTFRQCTIANNYLFSAVLIPNLYLEYALPKDTPDAVTPMQAEFLNCIIYGIGSSIYPGNLAGSQVYLRNVLLKEEGTNDDNFVDCIWDEDPMFLTVRADYYFNYRLAEDSPVMHSGNPAYVTPDCRYDMDGTDRLSEGAPALGAYAN